MKNKLTISIVTYQRAHILRDVLQLLIDEVQKYKIKIFIFDNSEDNLTEALIKKLSISYDAIYYISNRKFIGHDLNIINALSNNTHEYTWLLGDGIIIKKGVIKEIIYIIKEFHPNIIGINAVGRKIKENQKLYDDENLCFTKFAWHLTLTGSTVYSKSALSDMKKLNFKSSKNFPQINIIFNALIKNPKFFWIAGEYLSGHSKKISYWKNNVFEVFIDDWINVVEQLPRNYPTENKEKVINDHFTKTNIFSLRTFLFLRQSKYYNYRIFKKYKCYFKRYGNNNTLILLLISLLPSNFLGYLKTMYNFLKK